MSLYPPELVAHLASGATTVARAFRLTRADGTVFGFTDHDRDLVFDGTVFRADTGLTAKALQLSSGLSVDNSEAVGALRSDSITEEDILAGRYDGAEVEAWIVNWQDVAIRALQFRGTIGAVTRGGGEFTAELRGLAERLNQPQGRIYHPLCTSVLGDGECRFDLSRPGYAETRVVGEVTDARVFRFGQFGGYADRFFERGRFTVLTGAARGLVGAIKNDRMTTPTERTVELWQSLGISPDAGDTVRIEAGCDKLADTCRLKFGNFLNFRGFPDIPGEDWLMSYPVSGGLNDGGSLKR